MKVLFIVRATLFTTSGGDTIQVVNTAKHLRLLGIAVDIRLTHEQIDYSNYDLLHFFNIIRPADILYHVKRCNRPFVLSPIFVDYSEFDRKYRKGFSGFIFKFLSADLVEYLKTIARAIRNKEKIISREYLLLGHRKSVKIIINKAFILLPNSEKEYARLAAHYAISKAYQVVPNAVDTALFKPYYDYTKKNKMLILQVARIEGIKNQLNLIKALRNTKYTLHIIGEAAPNQSHYYDACRKLATPNIRFLGKIPQEELADHYRMAKVHVLPSFFETTGLSSLEAAIMGCGVVVSTRGDVREYFKDRAYYCEPDSPDSIYEAIDRAAHAEPDSSFVDYIAAAYNWETAAKKTAEAYFKTR